MKIEKIAKSKLATVNLDEIQFGTEFSDHMVVCDYEDGEWGEPSILPFGNFELSPSTQVLHYGQAVFEGMKAYKDEQGSVFLFRPQDNQVRLNDSAKRLGMPELPADIFLNTLHKLLEIDREWVPFGEGKSLYLRPFMFATSAMIAARPATEYRFCIITSPAASYYSKPLKVKVAEQYSRASSGGVGYAKAAGNYAAQFYPTALAQQEGYDQVVWTDSVEHKYIEEAGTMNVFVSIDGIYYTAPLSDRILNGVTRRSVLQIMKDKNIPVKEEYVSIDQLMKASENGKLNDAFGCGTAVTVNTIFEFGIKGKNYPVNLDKDPKSQELKRILLDIQYNRAEDPYQWRVKVV